MFMKLFLQEVPQCTLKCSTELKFSGFMDPQMHPHSHLHVITFLLKLLLKMCRQRTLSALKCRFCGSSDQMHPHWMWLWDVDVGCGMWDMGCAIWDVGCGCGIWDVGCTQVFRFYGSSDAAPSSRWHFMY